MRVVHVLEALGGGTSRHVVDIVRHARDVEHEVVVPPRRVGGLSDETAIGQLEAAGALVHRLRMRRAPWAPHNAWALARLARLLRERDPDIVHGHSSIGGLLARVAAIGLDRPRVYTPNGITYVRAGRAVERGLRRLTDRLVAVSESEGALALELGLIDPEGLVVIPNGIELERPDPIDLRARLRLPAEAPLVGMIGRCVPQKAPLDFVAACAIVSKALPDARFVLIGDGSLAPKVDGAVRAAGLGERFIRVPHVTGVAAALPSLDVFVLTSRFEGLPYTALEAMRAGTALVLTDVVGNRDVISAGSSGVLVPAAEPAKMASAIVEVLVDGERRKELATAARARLVELFDVRLMGERLTELYRTLNARRER